MTDWILFLVVPLSVVVVSFALKHVRHWLERVHARTEMQNELIEQFQDHVARFMRITDPDKHAELREILQSSGYAMMSDSFVQSFILFHKRLKEANLDSMGAERKRAIEVMGSLEPEARKAFAEAIGTALVLSSYRAVFMGTIYRSMLYWIVNGEDKSVKEPEQIVYRYRLTHTTPNRSKQTVSC
ncbi:hypothetical protein ABWH92_12475 [Ahrensia marina]|uniref:hypothetical protein n=1 Tax=Ahrensia marina TaxID=1514904 RepID=UPI0035D0212E